MATWSVPNSKIQPLPVGKRTGERPRGLCNRYMFLIGNVEGGMVSRIGGAVLGSLQYGTT